MPAEAAGEDLYRRPARFRMMHRPDVIADRRSPIFARRSISLPRRNP